jgi:hypothetical protein
MAKQRKTAAMERHHDFVAGLPCLACDRYPPSTVHHVTGYADRSGRFTKDHWLVVPLCPVHHQKVHDPSSRMPVSVEGLGHRGFYREHGINLLAEAIRLRDESPASERKAA